MPYRYGRTSQQRLSTAHEYLQRLFVAVLEDPECPCDVTILCGHRTLEEQAELYAQGRTKPGKIVTRAKPGQSRHNTYPSMAVDAAPYIAGDVSWDWDWYKKLAPHIKAVWSRLKAEGKVAGELQWLGESKSFREGPHWQLNF
jgi:peptidoglycan L-alanyl-D-glutamate endopeptidase CwlK